MKCIVVRLTVLSLIGCLLMGGGLTAQAADSTVKKHYQLPVAPLYWCNNITGLGQLRQCLVEVLDTAEYLGLNKGKYNYLYLKAHIFLSKADSANLKAVDTKFNEAAIKLCTDIYAGDITGYLSYDGVSPKCAENDKAYVTQLLSTVTNRAMLVAVLDSLEPHHSQYKTIKQDLSIALKNKSIVNIKKLTSEINYLRWITHFHFQNFILVNIPSGTLDYYRNDSAILTMRVVTGKPSTKTPRFAAYCNQVILYPYWNVPVSIGLHELLPQFKRSPLLVDGMNMQVISHDGRVINHHNINWASYNSSNFPYQFRQATGCDNALGVIKFDLTDPFSVYMHDTNNKLAFLLGARYFSHGCIRVEKPMDLANSILPEKIDSNLVASCLRNQKPIPIAVAQPVPVLVTYLITNPDLVGPSPFYKDVYRLFK